uniref:Neural retina-specific leucine zipper protein n=1 Tax=Syphacia muris TaxID=451379 RepID=A0A0N5ANZ3_9BILA
METVLTPLTPVAVSVSYSEPSVSCIRSDDCLSATADQLVQTSLTDQCYIISPSASPTLSTTSNSSTLLQVSDEELACLSVRQLNQRLQGQDRQVVSALKQKRRTLKNRGYAFNCRVRRIQNQLQLEADNVMLKNQVCYLKQLLEDLQARLAYYEPISTIPIAALAPSPQIVQRPTALPQQHQPQQQQQPQPQQLQQRQESPTEVTSSFFVQQYAAYQ